MVYITVFLFVWVTGMTAGLTAGACRGDRYVGTKKLGYCNVSLVAGFWLDAIPLERARRAALRLERGIALSQVGRDGDAAEDFARAIRDARSKSGQHERYLHARMVDLEDTHIQAIWVAVLSAQNGD